MEGFIILHGQRGACTHYPPFFHDVFTQLETWPPFFIALQSLLSFFFFLLIYPSPFSPNPQERIIVRVPYSFAAIVERQSSIKKELHAWKSLPFFRKIISFSKIFFASFSTFLMRGETLLIFEVTRFTDDDDDDGAWNF